MKLSLQAAAVLLTATIPSLISARPLANGPGDPIEFRWNHRIPFTPNWSEEVCAVPKLAAAFALSNGTAPNGTALSDATLEDTILADTPTIDPSDDFTPNPLTRRNRWPIYNGQHDLRVVLYGFTGRWHVDYIPLEAGDDWGRLFMKYSLCQCNTDFWDFQYHFTLNVGYHIKFSTAWDVATSGSRFRNCLNDRLKGTLFLVEEDIDWKYNA